MSIECGKPVVHAVDQKNWVLVLQRHPVEKVVDDLLGGTDPSLLDLEGSLPIKLKLHHVSTAALC